VDSEAKIILAFLFNRSGKTELTEAELYLPLSMELSWFSTKEAQQFVKYVIKKELVVKKDGGLSPNFPLETIKIPVGFIPSKKNFSDTTEEKKGKDIIEEIILQISQQTQLDKTHILEEMKKEGKEKNLLAEVTALYVGKKHGVDVSEWYSFVEAVLFKEKTG
jgi:hypothetical protein